MSVPSMRLLSWTIADGPWQMAADEVLLEAAANGTASLRFYGWSQATVSLGYFQPHAALLRQTAVADLPWLRRASGGGALVHHHEVTYAMALPPGLPWQTRESWLCRMHASIAGALEKLAVTAGSCPQEGEKKLGQFLCFQHHSPGDLLIGSAKIAGSAQRRQRGALLQHGGILLAASTHAPELPGIKELSGRQLTKEDIIPALCAEFEKRTGWQLEPNHWTPAELCRIKDLAARKYGQDSWNRKR